MTIREAEKQIYYTEITGDTITDQEATRRFVTMAQRLGFQVTRFAGWTNADLRPAPDFQRNPVVELQKQLIKSVLAALNATGRDDFISVFQVHAERESQ